MDTLDPAGLVALLGGSDDPVVVAGPEGSVVWANAAAGRVTGHAAADLVGIPVGSLDGYAALHVLRAGSPGRSPARPRALVVDDNDVNRLLLERMLAVVGVDAEAAADGETALAMVAAATRPFDVVLMDLRMPGEDGVETTRRLRAREAADGTRRTPVVAVSAAAGPADRARCEEVGMDGFLAKPVALADLRAVLGPHVALAPSAGRPSPAATASPVREQRATEPAVLERHRLEDLQDQLGDVALVRETVATYLEEMPHRRAAIAAALAGDDRDALRLVSHSLKSSSAMLGAAALAARCLAVERASIEAPRDELEPLVADLEAAAPLAVTALEEWLAG